MDHPDGLEEDNGEEYPGAVVAGSNGHSLLHKRQSTWLGIPMYGGYMQVDANIGDKLKLPINYNTLANF